MNKRIIFTILLLSCLKTLSFGQKTYFGAGFAGGFPSASFTDEAMGLSFKLQKEFGLGESRFHLDPTLDIAFLFSAIDKENNPFYATVTSFTPNVSYNILQSKRIVLAPFAGPYISWVVGSKRSTIYNAPAYMNDIRLGFEFGFATTILIKDDFSVKIIPFDYQVAIDKEGIGTYFLKFTASILISI